MHPFEQELEASWPPTEWSEVTVVIAVSGGPDSVALLRALVALRRPGLGRLVVAHFNHRWRGLESDRDEAFVRDLAAQHGLVCTVERAPVEAGRPQSEEAARGARLAFLQESACAFGARFVATAHTADDQVETILQRILRGTGLGGLAGIPRARPLGPATLLRPLLQVRRVQVLAYLAAIAQPFCDDATNLQPVFTRNRLRHELLPLLARDFNPDVAGALLRLGRLAAEAQSVLRESARRRLQAVATRCDAAQVELTLSGLRDEPRYLVRELFVELWRQTGWPEQDMSFAHWEALAELALGPTPGLAALDLPGGVRARLDVAGGVLRLNRAPVER
ncbi:MAG: tRNA lysidine(34) synthetase TilS [Pirellulales bacterium]|nr:tRNA lysidine(34) synthetase TilS [Pirellulales bacterium]